MPHALCAPHRNYNNDRSYSSSEEGGGGSGEYRPRGDRGGRGGGGYRGGDRNNSGGGGGRERQQLSEEKLSQNNRIAEAQSWRQLNMLLEAGDGGAGMDGFQLSALLLKAAKMQVADNADEQADFQQFIAKGEMRGTSVRGQCQQTPGYGQHAAATLHQAEEWQAQAHPPNDTA
jgi:hypothetical protein